MAKPVMGVSPVMAKQVMGVSPVMVNDRYPFRESPECNTMRDPMGSPEGNTMRDPLAGHGLPVAGQRDGWLIPALANAGASQDAQTCRRESGLLLCFQ